MAAGKNNAVKMQKVGMRYKFKNILAVIFISFSTLRNACKMCHVMIKRGNMTIFKRAISPKPERPHPLKFVCMQLTSIPTCMNFLSQFRSIKFFDDHGL